MANRVGGGFLKDFIYMFTVIRPSIPRITLPMPLQPRNYVVLIHHSIYSLTVCIVGKHVTYVRIQKIQIDGGRPICVDQLYRSRTKLRTSNTSLRSVLLEMMYWQKKYVAAWLVRYLTYMRPKLDTTGIACEGSLRTGCCQQTMKVGP